MNDQDIRQVIEQDIGQDIEQDVEQELYELWIKYTIVTKQQYLLDPDENAKQFTLKIPAILSDYKPFLDPSDIEMKKCISFFASLNLKAMNKYQNELNEIADNITNSEYISPKLEKALNRLYHQICDAIDDRIHKYVYKI